MKLKTFNRENMGGTYVKLPILSLYSSGTLRLGKELASEMKLKAGDRVELLQDESDPKSWFLVKGGADGWLLTSKGGNCLEFNCTGVVALYFKTIEYKDTQGRVRMGEPVKVGDRQLWPLMAGSIRSNRINRTK